MKDLLTTLISSSKKFIYEVCRQSGKRQATINYLIHYLNDIYLPVNELEYE